MSGSDIRPALTPSEWNNRDYPSSPAFLAHDRTEALIQTFDDGGIRIDAGRTTLEFFVPEDVHAIAALALHKQAFGFTWDDILTLEWALGCVEEAYGEEHPELRDLAARIIALLPPQPEDSK